MAQWLSPKQVAKSIGVSESSLKRWCDRGVLTSSRTPGGHRRVPLAAVIGYLREQKLEPTRPEILGLPEPNEVSFSNPSEAITPLVHHLTRGDFDASRSIVVSLFMTGQSVASIGDELLSPAMTQVGSHWEEGDVEIYEERRAVGVATRILHELSRLLPRSDRAASRAVGGTPVGDQYSIATLLVELTLREMGWNASSLGVNLPFETLARATEDVNPRVFWLSTSHIADPPRFVEEVNEFQSHLPSSTALVLGGRALDEQLRKKVRASVCCDGLQQLACFVSTLDAAQ